jgi:hypothetical protein
MIKIPDDSNAANPILEYPGDYLPSFFSSILDEIPDFELPDWGPLPPLLQNTAPSSIPKIQNPDRPAPIEIDPPARPPQWLFGPPRVVRSPAPQPLPAGLLGMIETYFRGQAADAAHGPTLMPPLRI